MAKTKEENFTLLVKLVKKAGLNENTATIDDQMVVDINAILTPLVKQIVAGTGAVKGDIVYVDANGDLAALPIGTNGQTLKVSAGGLPTWVTV